MDGGVNRCNVSQETQTHEAQREGHAVSDVFNDRSSPYLCNYTHRHSKREKERETHEPCRCGGSLLERYPYDNQVLPAWYNRKWLLAAAFQRETLQTTRVRENKI